MKVLRSSEIKGRERERENPFSNFPLHQVREGCHTLDCDLEVITCGSFRRGKPTCGDVDILITHPDGRSHKGIFQPLIKVLKDNGKYSTHRALSVAVAVVVDQQCVYMEL